jgi:hypothetical protein
MADFWHSSSGLVQTPCVSVCHISVGCPCSRAFFSCNVLSLVARHSLAIVRKISACFLSSIMYSHNTFTLALPIILISLTLL